jgi:FkbM family methyltransferase
MSPVPIEQKTKIIAHHVGARGFGVSFNPPRRFAPDIVNVLYEADADAAAKMSQRNPLQRLRLGDYFVLPYALGRARGPATLHVTQNSYASSLLEPDQAFYRYYCELATAPGMYDVDYEDMLRVEKKIDIEVNALDELFASGKIPCPITPDFLSIDTQGTELEILAGAQNVIDQGVVGIVTEVEILSMYRNQPLLGDMLSYMNRHGFYFAGFTDFYEVSPYRTPIGLRSRGLPAFGDALFLRRFDAPELDALDISERFLKLTKLGFISIVFGHLDYGLAALDASEKLRASVEPALLKQLARRRFWSFLRRTKAAAAAVRPVMPPRYATPRASRPDGSADAPPSWVELFHGDAAKSYYETFWGSETAIDDLMPAAPRFLRWLYRYLVIEPALSNVRLRHLLVRRPDKALAKLSYLLRRRTHDVPKLLPAAADRAAPSDIEKVLIRYGFHDLAKTVRRRRIAAEHFMSCIPREATADQTIPSVASLSGAAK